LAEFVVALQHDRHPPRVYKRSGIASDGSQFGQYLRLGLHHHHLHRRGDPLLVMQHIHGVIQSVALARHADYIHGDKMMWLQTHAEAIVWDGCEDLERMARTYVPDG
jgi:hypothetical protein